MPKTAWLRNQGGIGRTRDEEVSDRADGRQVQRTIKTKTERMKYMSTDITEQLAGKVAQTKKLKIMKRHFSRHLTRRALTYTLIGLSLAVASTAAQAQSQLTVLAQGLNNPRGLDFAENGSLYVAEAGLGAGDGNGGFAVGVGFTASITQINGVTSAHPIARRIVTGLASVGDTENGFPEALGPSGVSVQGAAGIYVTIGESALGVG